MYYCALRTANTHKEKQKVLQLIKFLLDNGADISHKNKKGRTCLEVCEKKSCFYADIKELFAAFRQSNPLENSVDKPDKALKTTGSAQNQNEVQLQSEEFEQQPSFFCSVTKCCSSMSNSKK